MYTEPELLNERLERLAMVLDEIMPNCALLVRDALELLKEQEEVKPIPPIDESDLWRCGYCHHQIFRCTHQRFCEECGRKIGWEDM